jgi:hypothetical protein
MEAAPKESGVFEEMVQYCYPDEIFMPGSGHEAFTCGIMGGVLREPVIDKCGHTFCRSCLIKWLTEKESCPLSKVKIRPEELVGNLIVRDYVDNMKATCVNFSKGCNWHGKADGLAKHLNTECELIEVDCPNLDCFARVSRRELKSHSLKCPETSISPDPNMPELEVNINQTKILKVRLHQMKRILKEHKTHRSLEANFKLYWILPHAFTFTT